MYKCYLLKDRSKVEDYYDQLKALGFETKDCIDSAINLFDRAKDLTQIDEDPDEVATTPTTESRIRADSGAEDSHFLLKRAESTVKERPKLDSSIEQFAVKVVRDNDNAKLFAHENEF